MRRPPALLVAALTLLAGCSPGSATQGPARLVDSTVPTTGATKVLVVVEERQPFDRVLGTGRAPYLDQLAATYGSALHLDAGYDRACPALPGYLLMTSGDTHKVCDDKGPWAHKVDGPSIFGQVTAAGREWRVYAEGMPTACARRAGKDNRFPARHAVAAYYTELRSTCTTRQLPMGTTSHGPLRDDVAGGALPAYAMVLPDVCGDMRGGRACTGGVVHAGDTWLARWLPLVLAGPDWTAGRLVVVVTWTDGSETDNHVPTLVLSPKVRGVQVAAPLTHCSMLRMEEELLGLEPLGCARTADSPRAAFHLAG